MRDCLLAVFLVGYRRPAVFFSLVYRSLNAGEASQRGDLRQQWTGTCLSKKQIIQAAEGSLRRLKTDYIDLFQLHWPDRYVPSQASGDYADVLFDHKVR